MIEAIFSDAGPWGIAAVALGAVLTALVAGAAGRGRVDDEPLVLGVLRLVLGAYAAAVHRLDRRPRGWEPVGSRGPALLVSNHRSGLDPLAIALLVRRRVRFLMAREYYERYGLRWFYKLAQAIPVNRDGNDLGATKTALAALRAGQVIGIFPQGGIRAWDAPLELKPGTALLALRTGAPVIPVHIDGSPNFDSVLVAILCPSRTRVTFGAPIFLGATSTERPSREQIAAATLEISRAMEALRPRLSPPAAASSLEGKRPQKRL